MVAILAAVAGLAGVLAESARFSLPPSAAAWRHLPRGEPPLPAWARALAADLPRTTAGLLALDHLHRAANPLGARLAAKLRYWAADALGSDYARAAALADFQRAGASGVEVERLRGGRSDEADRDLAAFARTMTKAAYQVTDREFAALVKRFGPAKMTAVVHTLAFANFQGRIILALGVRTEAGGPVAPVAVAFDLAARPGVAPPARPDWSAVATARPGREYGAPVAWKKLSFAELESAMGEQKARKPRVPVPGRDQFAALPAEARQQAETIAWMSVSLGYQPAMTEAWFACFAAFQQESRLNRVFSSSLFWVVTRANDCFY